jgi:hypothetical protein
MDIYIESTFLIYYYLLLTLILTTTIELPSLFPNILSITINKYYCHYYKYLIYILKIDNNIVIGIQDYVGHAVKLGGYLSASAAAGGVRHSTVDPSNTRKFVRTHVMHDYRRQKQIAANAKPGLQDVEIEIRKNQLWILNVSLFHHQNAVVGIHLIVFR